MVTNRRGRRGVERGQGDCYQWKAKGQCSRPDKCSFWHDEDRRAKPTPKNAPPLNHELKEVEVHRGKRTSEARVHLRSSLDSRAKITLKVFAPNHFVIIGILPNVKSMKKNRDANSVIGARLHTGMLKVNPAKKRKRMVT